MARKPDPTAPILTIEPAPGRRIVSALCLGVLAFLLFWIAVTQPPRDPLWMMFLWACVAAAAWGGYATWTATALTLTLTGERIHDSRGRVLCRIDEIASVDRGTFAFKPSNGFILRLKVKKPTAWAPGLWWSVGWRIGVGGSTGAGPTRAMAEVVTAMIAARDR